MPEPRWSNGLQLTDIAITVAFSVVVFIASIIILALAVILLHIHSISSPTFDLLNVIGTTIIYLGVLASIVITLQMRHHKVWGLLGYHRVAWYWLFIALAIGWLLQFIGDLVTALLGHLTHQATNVQACLIQSGYSQVPLLAAAVLLVIVPIVEETFFRGLLFGALRNRWTFMPSMLVSGAIFGILHGLSLGLSVLVLLPVLWGMGCLLAYLYQRTGSIYPGMVTHMAFNSLGVIAILTTSISCH
jgi:membrane protease YdiL (CAAX protease family)